MGSMQYEDADGGETACSSLIISLTILNLLGQQQDINIFFIRVLFMFMLKLFFKFII